MNLNKVFILGNLTNDPEIKSLPSGQAVASFGIATNRFFKTQQGEKRQEAEFHNIIAFGRLAEIASQYLRKGSLAFIEGRIRTRSWQDNSGLKRFRTEIIAESLQLGPKATVGNAASDPVSPPAAEEDIPVIEESSAETPEKSAKKGEEAKSNDDLENKTEEIRVEDIPF